MANQRQSGRSKGRNIIEKRKKLGGAAWEESPWIERERERERERVFRVVMVSQ